MKIIFVLIQDEYRGTKEEIVLNSYFIKRNLLNIIGFIFH